MCSSWEVPTGELELAWLSDGIQDLNYSIESSSLEKKKIDFGHLVCYFSWQKKKKKE